MALGKKLMNVDTTEKIPGEEKEIEKEILQEPEKDTGREPEMSSAAKQGSLKEILDNLADEEFIVTVPIGREENDYE